MSAADTMSYLIALVDALDKAFISSWQTTSGWQKELDAARDHIEASRAIDGGA